MHLHIERVCCAEGASADGSAAHSQKPATPSEPQSAVSFEPSIDWQLGVNGYLTAEALSVRGYFHSDNTTEHGTVCEWESCSLTIKYLFLTHRVWKADSEV